VNENELRATIAAASATRDRLGAALDHQAALLAEWERTPAPRPVDLMERLQDANDECRAAIAEAKEWVS
jgi:hypothetical protein